MFFEYIATLLNSLLAAIKNIGNVAAFVSNPLGIGTQNVQQSGERNTPLQEQKETKEISSPSVSAQATGKKRKAITIPEQINARFNDTGSPAWANQPGGRHLGTDFGAPNG